MYFEKVKPQNRYKSLNIDVWYDQKKNHYQTHSPLVEKEINLTSPVMGIYILTVIAEAIEGE